MVGEEEREMRRRKAFLVASLVLLLLGMGAWQCNQPTDTPTACPTSTPCPATPTPVDTSALETRIEALKTALATCEAGSTDTVEPSKCVERLVCPEAISAEHAIEYVGEIRTVQGKVVDSKFASGSSGEPTFLNLCYPYGDSRRFTALIWGEDRQEFIDCVGGLPEVVLLNREICVKGLIELYDGIPQIILKECHELVVLQ